MNALAPILALVVSLTQQPAVAPAMHGLGASEHAHVFGSGVSVGNAVLPTTDGGVVIVGYTTGGPNGGEDVLVVRTDRTGRAVWTSTIGGPSDDDGWAIAAGPEGGFVIAGFTSGFGADGEDILLVGLDAVGHTTWTKTYGGPGQQRAWAMTPAPGGGFFIAGQTDRGPGGGLDAYVLRVTAVGDLQWQRAIGGPGIDRVFGVVATADGGATVAGLSTAGPGAPQAAYLAHVDAQGVAVWERRHGGAEDTLAHALLATSDGGYLLTGYGKAPGAAGNAIVLTRCAANGDLLWRRATGGAIDDRGMMSVSAADGGVVTVGYRKTTASDWDIWIGTFDSEGRLRSERTIGGAGPDRGVMIARVRAGEIVLTGALGGTAPDTSALLVAWLRAG